MKPLKKNKEVVMMNKNWFVTPCISVNLSQVLTITLRDKGILFHLTTGEPVLVEFDDSQQAEAEYQKLIIIFMKQ